MEKHRRGSRLDAEANLLHALSQASSPWTPKEKDEAVEASKKLPPADPISSKENATPPSTG